MTSHACTPILVGVVPPVSEIYNRSELAQKFMHVGVDVRCMHTSFGGCDHSGFGDMATFQKQPNFPFGAYSPLSWKILIDRNRLKKFMQVRIDVTCMHTNFCGCDPSCFNMATFQKRPNFYIERVYIERL